MIVVRFPGLRNEDLGLQDADTIEQAINHAGRLAIVRNVYVDPDAPDNALPIGETRGDPRLDIQFSDGWTWTVFLDEIDLVTRCERPSMAEMHESLAEARDQTIRTPRDRLAKHLERAHRKGKHRFP